MLPKFNYKNFSSYALALFLLLNAASVFAFGRVDKIAGEVVAINVDGQTRTLTEGSRIETGDNLATGDKADVLIITDDKGLLAIRANSRVVVEEYRAKGTPQDKFTLNLLKGALRSVTGFIGKTAPKNYQIKTVNATIGIRGTDHEIAVIEDKNLDNEAGTYSKVNTGEVYLASRGITVDIKAGQFGLVPKAGMPQVLATPPKDLFNRAPLDDRLNTLKITLDPEAENTLNQKQAEQKTAGGITTSGELKIPKNCGFDTLAQKGLDEFFSAYEAGNIGLIRRRLDPAMPGYGAFLNSIIEDMNNQKQARFLIKDRTAQCGSDLASINFKWEKRYLDLANFKPQLQVGQASVLVYLKNGEWKLSGITGDNPFAPSLASQANELSIIPAQASYSGLPQSCSPGPTSTLTGTATATQPLFEFSGVPTCNAFTVPSCSIAGYSGTVTSALTCSGTPIPTGTIYNATGNTPFSSTGAANSQASVTKVIPVSGTSPNGQAASGSLSCTAIVTYPTGSPVCGVTSTTISTQLKLISASRAGAGSAQVEARTSNGDREIFTLTETTKGTFVLSGIPVGGGSPIVGNGRIDLTGPTVITLSFADSRTGSITSTQFNITP